MSERFNGPYKRYTGLVEDMKPGDVFESVYQGRLHFISYLCPCGCGRHIGVPAQGSYIPESWKANFDEAGLLSMTPSFVMLQGCKSHYFITGGMIQWC